MAGRLRRFFSLEIVNTNQNNTGSQSSPLAGEVSACIRTRNFFVGLERLGDAAGAGEEGHGELEKLWREWAVPGRHEDGEGLFDCGFTHSKYQ
jgi:hypothetical protein